MMEEIAVWIADVLTPQWGTIRQIETVKQRPWSIVLRVTADRGISYFKVCGAGGRHEPSLLRWLETVYPAMMPVILATSIESGWLLLADAGIGLRDLSSADQISYLEKLLPHYAELQRDSIAQIEPLLQMQLPDRRLEKLPALLQDLLETELASGTIDADLCRRVLYLIPKLEQICQRLATSQYAAAIDQGDLHSGNILIKAGIARICDWGDACITHPFGSLFPLLQTLSDKVENKVQNRLIDAYLEPWTSFNSIQVLRSELRLFQISPVLRALDMAHMLKGADQSSLNQWSPYIAKYLYQWHRLLD